ncbi:MAG: hypothetical protein RTU30_00205 [Candidatus Thorarchaeota archaeon]
MKVAFQTASIVLVSSDTQAHKGISRYPEGMTAMRVDATELWEKAADSVIKRFRLKVPSSPLTIKTIDDSNDLRIGGYYEPSTQELALSAKAEQRDIPLEGVIFREALLCALPIDFCVESKRDIASEFARQSLDREARENWGDLWKEIPSIRIRANLIYNSFRLINGISTLGGDKELDLIVHEFVTMSRYGIHLRFTEYVEYLVKRHQNIMVELSETEVRILDTILRLKRDSYREVAKATGLSESWASTKINNLKQKLVLSELTATPFSRMGIRTFHILLAGLPWTDPSPLISGCPFLYNIRFVLNGPWQVLARLAVPDNSSNIRAIEEMATILTENGVAVDYLEVCSAGMTHSFYHYNTPTHRWNIPWSAMLGWGTRIHEEGLDVLLERIDTPPNTTDEYLDELDIQIMVNVQHGLVTTRDLRKNLAIGQRKLLSRLKKLRNAGLITQYWNVRNIGLNEQVAIRVSDSRVGRMVDMWSRELPRNFVRYGEREDLFLVADLPIGASARMMDTLRTLKWPVTVSPLGSGVWGNWAFPAELWNVAKQRWNAPIDTLSSWLESLAVNAEKAVNQATQEQRGEFIPARSSAWSLQNT